jgi:phosphomannomutase
VAVDPIGDVRHHLLLAEIVATTGKGLREYIQEIFDAVGYFTYDRIDLHLGPDATEAVRVRVSDLKGLTVLAGMPIRQVFTLDGTKFLREDASWRLIRPSGTEPVLRIYAEARSKAQVQALLAEGKKLAGV